MAEDPPDIPQSPADGGPASDAPPPTYAVQEPQILVAPLPDSPSFFWGRTVQGEVFVKGLGSTDNSSSAVQSLTVHPTLTDTYPDRPTLPIRTFDVQTIYPPSLSASSSSRPNFPSINRFKIALPPTGSVPGTLNLSSSRRGEVKWTLAVVLTLTSGLVVTETVPVDGTPTEIDPAGDTSIGIDTESPEEVEEVLEKSGVRCRMLLDSARPRLGSLLRLGVEVRPMERRKTGVAGLSTQPNPAHTLRPLRRVRVEMFRRVRLPAQNASASPSSSSSSSSRPSGDPPQHLSLLYASGKSLRYPGNNRTIPPLRVLFTIPTTQLGSVADNTWGEITQSTPYHTVSFFIRTTIGFGAGESGSTEENAWTMEREIEVRPKKWREPRQVVLLRGEAPALGHQDSSDSAGMTDDEVQQAYRLKGMDVVGTAGTNRLDRAADLPPPFDGAGPSQRGSGGEVADGGLPTFLESEAQARAGEAPLPSDVVMSERLVPVEFETEDDRNVTVGRRGSLGGELGTWIEYDGYEMFSVAPPSVSASFGAAGVMDPPQEGDDDHNVVGGMMGRLGIEGGSQTGRDLIESLGLGEGSRVVDLHDDLPPGIDEPSLPALPNFGGTYTPPRGVTMTAHQPDQPPPSFAASEAAVAQRRASMSTQLHPAHTARSHPHHQQDQHRQQQAPSPHVASAEVMSHPMVPHGSAGQAEEAEGEAPPGYFGNGGQNAGPPAYS